jgi:hypothetical protein
MTGKRDSFSKLDVTVTLTGEEWFALLSRLDGRSLSPKGMKVWATAARELQIQILNANMQAACKASLQQEGGEQ